MRSNHLRGQHCSGKLGQRRAFLPANFVDVGTDDGGFRRSKHGIDGLEGVPKREASWHRRSGRGNKRSVQSVDVNGQMNRSFDGVQRRYEACPRCGTTAGGHQISSEMGFDAVVISYSLLFLERMCSNAELDKAAYTQIKGACSGACVRPDFAVQFRTEVGVCVDLYHGKAAEVALNRGVIPHRGQHRREDAVLSTKGEGKHITCSPWSDVTFQIIELLEKVARLARPRAFRSKRQPRREVLLKDDVVQFYLCAGLQAGHWAVRRPLPVGGCQLVRQWKHDHVRRGPCILIEPEHGWNLALHASSERCKMMRIGVGQRPSGQHIPRIVHIGCRTIYTTVAGECCRAAETVIRMSMTLEDLTRAIQQHIDTDMDMEVARGMAEHALGFFGFYNRIIDNALEPNDRNLFYMFQDWDLLTTESEETTLWDGREWRIHYWKFKPDLRERVEAYMQRNLDSDDADPYADIYAGDGSTIWMRESERVTNPNAFTSDW